SLAAILRQKTHQFRHAIKVGGIVDELSILARRYQTGAGKFFQMKRQCCTRDLQRLTNATGGYAIRSRFDELTEYRQSCFLSKCSERGYGSLYFHISNILEIMLVSTPCLPQNKHS